MSWKRGEYSGIEYTSPSDRHWFHFVPVNDWREWMPWNWEAYNWRNFHLAHVAVEDDKMCAGWEVDFVLLGLGFHIRYTDQVEFDQTEVGLRTADCMAQLPAFPPPGVPRP